MSVRFGVDTVPQEPPSRPSQPTVVPLRLLHVRLFQRRDAFGSGPEESSGDARHVADGLEMCLWSWAVWTGLSVQDVSQPARWTNGITFACFYSLNVTSTSVACFVLSAVASSDRELSRTAPPPL